MKVGEGMNWKKKKKKEREIKCVINNSNEILRSGK